MRLILFGGTTEGRELAGQLSELGHDVTVSVATPLGAEELRCIPNVEVMVGRMDEAEMTLTIAGFDACIDATHPYAVVATETIRLACKAAGVPLRRLLRQASATNGCRSVASCADAARMLAEEDGNILIATGAKELPVFSDIDPNRLFPRLLPTHAGIDACEALGVPHRNIIAMQGPFSYDLNVALMRQLDIRWMVTKDGGRAGGFEEKINSARDCGVQVVLVARPEDSGTSASEIIKWVKEECR